MGRTEAVTDPEGGRWQVRRRWLERPLPELRKRVRERPVDLDADDALNALWIADGIDSLSVSVAIGVASLVLVLILLPLLGIAIELLAVLVLVGAGVFGRVVLRRPWIVEARNLDDERRSVDYAVTGWRASSLAIKELRRTIAVAGPPER
jgi:hypothetical protein